MWGQVGSTHQQLHGHHTERAWPVEERVRSESVYESDGIGYYRRAKSIVVGHLDGFTSHLGLSRLGSRPHLGPTPGITRAQLSPPGDCEVIPGV